METKILDVVLEDNPFIELNIVRSFVLKKRYEMDFSDKLKCVIKKYVYSYAKREIDVAQKLYETQNVRYKKSILSEVEFGEILSEIIDN